MAVLDFFKVKLYKLFMEFGSILMQDLDDVVQIHLTDLASNLVQVFEM